MYINTLFSQAWGRTPVIPAFGRLRQDYRESEADHKYAARPRLKNKVDLIWILPHAGHFYQTELGKPKSDVIPEPGTVQKGAQQQSPGAPNAASFSLPASHHYLDVLPLIVFLLRRGIRLGRHDCPSQVKACPRI